MKVTQHNITMKSDHSLEETYQKEESLRSWVGNSRPDFENDNPSPPQSLLADTLKISKKALDLSATAASTVEASNNLEEYEISEDPKLMIIRRILESLTGKKIKVANISDLNKPPSESLEPIGPSSESETSSPDRAGRGLEYDLFESHSEVEEMVFKSEGTILTEDGKDIAFTIDLNMKREFAQHHSLQIRAGDALMVDPLVINFQGTAAELTNTKFDFDLDNDGQLEKISYLKPGSGFLFLDLNEDNKATNGRELFGPTTNDGFLELKKYDVDDNGWIDENDPIFEKLQIWSKDAAGNDYFSSLSDKNIGAIFLESQETEFTFKNQENSTLGEVIATSIFIRNQGTVGTLQEVNLVV